MVNKNVEQQFLLTLTSLNERFARYSRKLRENLG